MDDTERHYGDLVMVAGEIRRSSVDPSKYLMLSGSGHEYEINLESEKAILKWVTDEFGKLL